MSFDMNSAHTPAHSETIMTEVVFPNDTNPMGFLNGGRLVQWMDTACAVAAQRHSGSVCVTAGIEAVRFEKPAKLGDIVVVKAKLTRVFTSSMEIAVEARAFRTETKEEFLINGAYFIFVALDPETGKPQKVPDLKPETPEEIKQFQSAIERKEKRKYEDR